jgi:hypothetical protein
MTKKRFGSHIHPAAEWKPGAPLEFKPEERTTAAMITLYSPDLPVGDRDAWTTTCRAFNKAAAVAKDRYNWLGGAYAAIPFPYLAEALDEIHFALDELNLDGVCIFPVVQESLLDDIDAAPIINDLSRRKATVLIHPINTEGVPILNERYLDAVLFTARMMHYDRLKECPGIRFTLSHTAGIVPYLGENLGMLQYMQAGQNKIGKFMWDYLVKKRLEGDIILQSLYLDAADCGDTASLLSQETYFEAEHVLV